MFTPSVIFAIVTTAILAIFIDRVIIQRLQAIVSKRRNLEPTNKLPPQLPSLTKSEDIMMKYYIEEWKTIIQTQMHFNDLIIRFRSISLTTFVSFVGAIFIVQKSANIATEDLVAMAAIALVFWVAVGILDYFYYLRLLLGSVTQALKFDQSEHFKKYGLFGITTTINNHIHPPTSKVLIFFYYSGN